MNAAKDSQDLSEPAEISAEDAYLKKRIQVAEVFSPSAPINTKELFSGRIAQVNTVINAVAQRGQHVILFGERGVGKTSLANVISQIMQSYGLQGIGSGTINCDSSDDFSSLWHKIFRELVISQRLLGIGFESSSKEQNFSLDDIAPEKLNPELVRQIIQNSIGKSIIVIDEVDRINDKYLTQLIADTVKTFSDHSVDSTIILVGVSDSVDNLIQGHASIERSLIQIPMPRMSPDELYEIIQKGFDKVEMSIDDDVKKDIVNLSQGLPSYTHRLALHAAQAAIDRQDSIVLREDLKKAILLSVETTQQSIKSAYHKGTFSVRETLYSQVLLACALVKVDELGYFTASEVKKPMSLIRGKNCDISVFSRHLNDFCELKRGNILQKIGAPRSYKFRFRNPMVQPYIVMAGLAKGLIDISVVKDFQVSLQ